jgi:hypothetical protein
MGGYGGVQLVEIEKNNWERGAKGQGGRGVIAQRWLGSVGLETSRIVPLGASKINSKTRHIRLS